MPEAQIQFTNAQVAAFTPDELLDAEFRSHVRFAELDASARRSQGTRYNLVRNSPELMAAWELWSRLARAVEARLLSPRRLTRAERNPTGTRAV